MIDHTTLPALACLSLLLPAAAQAPAVPPLAKVRPQRLEAHGDVRTDPYFWLRQRDDPEVVRYLEAENAYTAAVLAPTRALQQKLFEEIRGRSRQDDTSAPYRIDDWWFYRRYLDGKPYPLYCRKHRSLDAEEQVLLDVNALAAEFGYFAVNGIEPSIGHDVLAYAADTVGRRQYTIRFKNLDSGELLADVITGVTGNLAWALDNRTLFYSRQDPQTLRSDRIYRHVLGTPVADDALVYEERDPTFGCYVTRTRSRQYLLITSSQTLRTEIRTLRADDPGGEWRLFLPREADHDYDVDHQGDRWLIRTNWRAKNFRVMAAPLERTAKEHWTELLPGRDDVLLESVAAFDGYFVASERSRGLTRLRIVFDGEGGERSIAFDEPAYSAGLAINPTFATDVVRYNYTSLTTPPSTYDYDVRTGQKTLVKRDPVLGGFDAGDWVTERLQVEATDGALVPVSLVHRKGMKKDGSHPLLLYGYGAYGYTLDASFSAERLSLLDRGFVYAIAHVRGSQANGRAWYEDGKLLHKKNTFTDFIAVAEHLIAAGYTGPERLFAEGGSAGGLLIGAVINLRPDLFKGVLADVPFVDVVTTMLDDSIPLTTGEYDEWGDPHDRRFYDYMLSYSPYDNVQARAYPHMLVTTGLHDSQVQYWEPAKWVAKLRATKTDDHRLLLHTNLQAGHGGASGRYDRYRETALRYAFLLDLAGIRD